MAEKAAPAILLRTVRRTCAKQIRRLNRTKELASSDINDLAKLAQTLVLVAKLELDLERHDTENARNLSDSELMDVLGPPATAEKKAKREKKPPQYKRFMEAADRSVARAERELGGITDSADGAGSGAEK